jgi:hypothetical protein
MPGSKQAATPAFYVFNAQGSFVIVSGDDRARPVLACGDGEVTDLHMAASSGKAGKHFIMNDDDGSSSKTDWLPAPPEDD